MKNKLSINIIFSLFLQIIAIVNSFITTKITILYFGTEINGLISSINQFLNYVSLLEGGIGAVVMANLYRPLYEHNMVHVSNIIESSRKFFRQIIYIYMGYVVILSFFYPMVTKTNMSTASVALLIWILSISLSAQYFFAISYKILLQADHKLYICSIIQIIAYILNIIFVILSSIYLKNIVLVKLLSSCAFLMQPLLYTIIVKKIYSIKKSEKKETYQLKGRWDGFFQNLAFFINNNTDIVLITFFLNLNEVSVYSVYMLVINGMKSVILSISSGFQSVLGRALASQDINKLENFFEKYFYIIMILSIFGFGTSIMLVRSFVLVYIGSNADYHYDRIVFPIVIALSQMVICIREPLNLLIISANKFKETNKGAAFEAILNIVISMVLLKVYGLVGVAVGTLIASVCRLSYFVVYLRKNIIYLDYKKIIKPFAFAIIYIAILICIYLNFKTISCLNWLYFLKRSLITVLLNLIFVIILLFIFWPSGLKEIARLCGKRLKK